MLQLLSYRHVLISWEGALRLEHPIDCLIEEHMDFHRQAGKEIETLRLHKRWLGEV